MSAKKQYRLILPSTIDSKYHSRMKAGFEAHVIPFLEKHLSGDWKDLFSRFKFTFTARRCVTQNTSNTVMKRWGAQHIKDSAIAGTALTGLVSIQIPDNKYGFLFWIDIDIPDGDEKVRKGLFAHIKGLQIETFPIPSPKSAGTIAANAAAAQQPLGTSVSFHMETPTVGTPNYASANSWLVTVNQPYKKPDPVQRPVARLSLDHTLSAILPRIPDKNLGAAVSIAAELKSSLQTHVDAWKRIEELLELMKQLAPTN